ncbi:MAG: DUF805 domain-containing protein [Maledivibacter sp.]|nr:DUF805 domain-containing protein [Maledivibacter sp.]
MDFKSYFSFEGRVNRAHFLRVIFLLGIFFNNIETDIGYLKSIFLYATCIIFAIAGICIIIKRLHDLEISGGFIFLLLIPFISTFLIILLVFIKGTYGPNKYGEDPLVVTDK